jgi:hypothetical protein
MVGGLVVVAAREVTAHRDATKDIATECIVIRWITLCDHITPAGERHRAVSQRSSQSAAFLDFTRGCASPRRRTHDRRRWVS